jgi:hypothetical protein
VLKPNAYGLPQTEANQPPPIALSEAQMGALLAASYRGLKIGREIGADLIEVATRSRDFIK